MKPTDDTVVLGKAICPRCGSGMDLFQHGEVILDLCRKCMSVWFDEEELAAFFGGRHDLPNRFDLLATYDENGPRCPRDGGLLQQFQYRDAEVTTMEIDRCPFCHGVLLDKGEISAMKHIFDKEVGVAFKKFLNKR